MAHGLEVPARLSGALGRGWGGQLLAGAAQKPVPRLRPGARLLPLG